MLEPDGPPLGIGGGTGPGAPTGGGPGGGGTPGGGGPELHGGIFHEDDPVDPLEGDGDVTAVLVFELLFPTPGGGGRRSAHNHYLAPNCGMMTESTPVGIPFFVWTIPGVRGMVLFSQTCPTRAYEFLPLSLRIGLRNTRALI